MYGVKKLFDLKILSIILLLIIIPFFLSQYHLAVLNLILIYVIVILGYNIAFGYTGLFSLANAAFYGLGAYSSSLLIMKMRIPVYFAMVFGGLFAALIALIVCILILQTKMTGLYIGMVTFAFEEFVAWVFLHWPSLTGGAFGLTVDSKLIFGTNAHLKIYFMTFISVSVLVFFAVNIINSKFGRALISIRDSEEASMGMGVNTSLYKVLGLAINAFYAGIGGALYSIVIGQIYPENFGMHELLKQFSMLLVGGQGTIVGSIIGAGILSFVMELLRKFSVFQELFYGVILGVFILFMPDGIYGYLRRIKEEW